MEFMPNLKRVVFKSCLAVLFCSILLWFSIFLYGLLYYSYIPAIAHFMPIYLQFDPTCSNSQHCRFPSANVSLAKKDHRELLTRGQAYAVEVSLDMPESERNFNQGNFMIKINMLSQYGKILQSSLRPGLLHYKSSLFKVLYTFFYSPGLLAGTVEEKQHIVVSIFEQYEEDPFSPTHFVYIEIQARNIEIYESNLRIHARFTGLRYFMYYWPITATVLFVGTNFFFLSVIFAFIWFRQILNESYESAQSMSWREQDRLTEEIRKSVRKKKALESPSFSAYEDVNFEDFHSQQMHPRVQEIPLHTEHPIQNEAEVELDADNLTDAESFENIEPHEKYLVLQNPSKLRTGDGLESEVNTAFRRKKLQLPLVPQ